MSLKSHAFFRLQKLTEKQVNTRCDGNNLTPGHPHSQLSSADFKKIDSLRHHQSPDSSILNLLFLILNPQRVDTIPEICQFWHTCKKYTIKCINLRQISQKRSKRAKMCKNYTLAMLKNTPLEKVHNRQFWRWRLISAMVDILVRTLV